MTYRVSGEGMKRGYWKIVNVTTGLTERSGFVSKAAAQQITDTMNAAEQERHRETHLHPHRKTRERR